MVGGLHNFNQTPVSIQSYRMTTRHTHATTRIMLINFLSNSTSQMLTWSRNDKSSEGTDQNFKKSGNPRRHATRLNVETRNSRYNCKGVWWWRGCQYRTHICIICCGVLSRSILEWSTGQNNSAVVRVPTIEHALISMVAGSHKFPIDCVLIQMVKSNRLIHTVYKKWIPIKNSV